MTCAVIELFLETEARRQVGVFYFEGQFDPKRHLHEPLRGLESKRLARDDKWHAGLYSSGHEADRRYRRNRANWRCLIEPLETR